MFKPVSLTSDVTIYTKREFMSSKKFIILNDFSSRLRDLIKIRLKISQLKFSEITGIDQSYLSMVLKEKSGPSADMIAALFIHYPQYLNWLITGEDFHKMELINSIGESQKSYGSNSDSMAYWSDDIKNACLVLKRIIESNHPIIKPALMSNLVAFEYSEKTEKTQADEIKDLKKRITHLEGLTHPDGINTGTDEAE